MVVLIRPRIEDECRECEGRKGESRLVVVCNEIFRERRLSDCEVRNKFELIVDTLQEIRLPALLGMGRISVVMGSIGPR